MNQNQRKTISLIIPAYNEEKNIPLVYEALQNVCAGLLNYDFEMIFVNDGSADSSTHTIENLVVQDIRVKHIEFSRNFGKEIATTAGIHGAIGDAAIMIDADLQHPVEFIPQFIAEWEKGNDVVVGVRTKNKNEGFVKKYGSYFYYKIMSIISETNILPGETDYRLIDRAVIDAFKLYTERDRMTRALINWLGFKRSYIYFKANERVNGEASYSFFKLLHLATYSFVSHSLFPLKLVGYLGTIICTLSGIFGLVIIFEHYVFDDVFNWGVSGAAQFAVLTVFLVGVILISLGLVAIYIGNINTEMRNRPLYVIRKSTRSAHDH